MFSLPLILLPILPLISLVAAQAPNVSSSTPLTTSLTTSTFTTTATSRSGAANVVTTQVITTVYNVTRPISVPVSSAAVNASSTPTPTPAPITLDTRINPGFGVLGVILIVTGLPSAFWGHKNRWSSFFLIGFYTLALTCLALILKFGVLSAVNPPNQTLVGIFVLSCCVAGVAGGGITIFFWQQAKYFIGGWGGFAVGLWVQCFRNGGLIRPIGLRWILYISLGVVGFVLCTIPKIHYHILLVSTAIVGATAFILGIDCFTTAGLKEFYVWNLGFDGLFPKFQNAGIHYPISQMMQVELGLIAAVGLMGAAVQWRVLRILQYKLKEITLEQKRRDEELEAQATARFAGTAKEMDNWEKEHGRKNSQHSSIPLMKDQEHSSPGTEENSQAATLTPGAPERRARYHSGVSEFMAARPSEDEFGRPKDRRQSIGVLPAMDLGTDIEGDLPRAFVADTLPLKEKSALTVAELEDIKKKEQLLAEIHTIRKSIEVLSTDSPESRSRRQSFASRRTLSQDFSKAMEGATHLRPPRTQDPRARRQSIEVLSRQSADMTDAAEAGASIGRPTSVPLRDENWDAYVQDRKLFQPPSGVTAPIATSPTSPNPNRLSQFMTVPSAVADALARRKQTESALELGEYVNIASGRTRSPDVDERPVRSPTHGQMRNSTTIVSPKAPITILPPRKDVAAPTPRPSGSRTRTFEELTERHREKMRNLQAPLSKQEQEQAELLAAKSRWERSKALEKQAMEKRDAERLAAIKQAERKSGDVDKRASRAGGDKSTPTRALSPPPAGGPSSTSKRQSLMKVEDWQRYQQEPVAKDRSLKRDSAVPFPSPGRTREPGHPSTDKRRSSRRDPPK